MDLLPLPGHALTHTSMSFLEVPKIILLCGIALTFCKCEDNKRDPCFYLQQDEPFDYTVLHATSDFVSEEKLTAMKERSRVCLPYPCDKLEAYSGVIPVDDSDSSYAFFLHIVSESHPGSKPLLLWLQGGPWKSSLFSQFLENGPLGIDAAGNLYRREHSLIKHFNVIYLDQPIGSGYSFDEKSNYPGTLQEACEHTGRFLKRFLRIFPHYLNRHLYIAGESYGARSATGMAYHVLKRTKQFALQLKGVMLGAGFLFPLLEMLNSAEYLRYSGLLNDFGKKTLEDWLEMANTRVQRKEYALAAQELKNTLLNMHSAGERTLLQLLTGFKHHGNIAKPLQAAEVDAYFAYANSVDFKRIIHVNSSARLDEARPLLTTQLELGDFFVDIKKKLVNILDNVPVLFYTAQMDAVFPEVNIERSFRNLEWQGSEEFKSAERKLWYKEDNSSLELYGYERRISLITYTSKQGCT